jgi:general secretion pathway protein H
MGGKAVKVQRPRSSTDSADRQRSGAHGYMLLDLALALAILLLLFAVAWPVVGRGTSNARQAAVALDIATLLRVDRSFASSKGVPVATRFDLGRRTVIGATGRRIEVPGDLAMTITTAAQCVEGGQRFAILFAPDGTSCGGVIVLGTDNETHAIRINWLSGAVDVAHGPKA